MKSNRKNPIEYSQWMEPRRCLVVAFLFAMVASGLGTGCASTKPQGAERPCESESAPDVLGRCAKGSLDCGQDCYGNQVCVPKNKPGGCPNFNCGE